MQLEENAYELTITNQSRVMVKERMIEVIPEIVNAMVNRGKQATGLDGIGRLLRQIEDDMLRMKLGKLLK